MAHYRLYFLNEVGRITRAENIKVDDDEGAKEAARLLDHAHHIEVWTGKRKVGTVMPEKEPSSSGRDQA